ncbi:MAG TPA: hypothetical protein VMW24_27095 [Sedimentisphaerales bacterium]|nr:hypothetical protein [Sedimentisphaerales bacterium]
MDKPTLVDADMKAGEALLNKLDETRFDVKAALWFYMPESEEWRLILASPTVDAEGPKKAYEKVQSQLQGLDQGHELSLQNISLVSPGDNLIKVLKSAIKTGKKISHIRFTRNVINNVFIEDAYIYRLM